jgi:hypothetical protein
MKGMKGTRGGGWGMEAGRALIDHQDRLLLTINPCVAATASLESRRLRRICYSPGGPRNSFATVFYRYGPGACFSFARLREMNGQSRDLFPANVIIDF